MRVLCLDTSGNVRSVTLARLLRKRGAETLAVGYQKVSWTTLCMLTEWAETIYVAEPDMVDRVPTDDQPKVSLDFCVGPDDWAIPQHPDLVRRYRYQIEVKERWKARQPSSPSA